MQENNNQQKQSKSSIFILIVVAIIVVGIIVFSLYQNSDNKDKNNTTATTVAIEISSSTIEETTEPKTEPITEAPTTEPETQPTTQVDYGKEAYIAYLETLNSEKDKANLYYLYDIDNDGIEELIIETGEYSAEMECKFYSYKAGVGNIFLGSTVDMILYGSLDGTLLGMGGKMGYYTFYEMSIENGKIVTNVTEEGYVEGEYPEPDGEYLNSYSPEYTDVLSDTFLK